MIDCFTQPGACDRPAPCFPEGLRLEDLGLEEDPERCSSCLGDTLSDSG